MRTQAVKLGLRSLVTHQRKCKGQKKYRSETIELRDDIDWRYFDTWSNNMTWMLGYIFADGSIRGNALRCGCKWADRELLEIVKRELKSPHKISDPYLNPKNGKPRCTLDISCQALVNRLRELHGVLPRKSYLDISYPFVPDDFLGHFARGFLDGDGSIPATKDLKYGGFQWSGGYKFLDGLMCHISFILDIPSAVISPNGSIFRFQWKDRRDVIKLYHLIYPEGDYPYLKRKREKIERVLRNRGFI